MKQYKVTFKFNDNVEIECEHIESDRGVSALHKAMMVLEHGWMRTTWPKEEMTSVLIEEE